MPGAETIEFQVRDRTLSAPVRRPRSVPRSGAPTVLIVDDATGGVLSDSLATAAGAAGWIVARLAPDVFAGHVRSAEAYVDCLSALFRALFLRDDVHAERIVLVGIGLGGALAACLTGRTEQPAGLCLISPQSESDEAWIEADSLSALDPEMAAATYDRPTLLLAPALDENAIGRINRYATALGAAGRRVQRILVAGADRGWSDAAARAATVGQVIEFLKRRNPAAMPV